MSLGTRLFLWTCPALLPPNDPGERDYYAVLGLERGASLEEIRQAYRTKSLDLHPDRIAYRRESQQSAEEAAQEYEQVQEAYSVLSDPKQKKYYATLGYSPARYRFMTRGGSHNPVALYENLSKSSCADKTRLVLLVSVFLCLILLQPILIAAKVNQDLDYEACVQRGGKPAEDCEDEAGSLVDTKWVVILIPLWVFHGLIILFWALMVAFVPDARGKTIVTLLEQCSWLVGFVLLARAWDDNGHDVNWYTVSIPFFVALVLKIYGSAKSVSGLREEQSKMVSPDFLLAHEGPPEDLSEERRLQLAEEFIVVTVDHHTAETSIHVMTTLPPGSSSDAEAPPPLTDEDIEAIKVQSSPEFQMSERLVRHLQRTMGSIVLIAIPFVALVASKLEDRINVSWWVVFTPIWVHLGWQILAACGTCCCTSVGSDEIVIVPGNDTEEGEDPEQGSDERNREQNVATSEGQQAVPDGDSTVDEQEANRKEKAKEFASFTAFASAEGDIRQFNQSPENDTKKNRATGSEQTDNRKTDAPAAGGETPDKNTQVGEEENEPDINIDEDYFRAWHNAQAEESAMEKQAKAQSTCCLVCFQLMIVCLIVGKIEQDYDSTDGKAGYKAILFPVFVVMGLLLCLCSCLIYGSGATSLDELVERAKAHSDEEGGTQGGATEEIHEVPVVPETEAKVDHSKASREDQTATATGCEVTEPERSAKAI